MDNTTYPSSENDNCDHCEFQSTTSGNGVDYIDQWVNLTVEKEVLRGAQLREEKLKSYPQLTDCEVVNIDFVQPLCYGENLYRKSAPGRNYDKSPPCGTRSNSPFNRQMSVSRCPPGSMYSRSNMNSSLRNKCAQRCPMRIAELAVPTKRQCIDTWRNKCDVLPACMVERLRQQIMDEKPIVQISDAITCFQRRRPKSAKSTKRTKGKRENKQKFDRNAEIRRLCAAFSSKIASRLITPRNLNLNPELDKLSKVVANEITKIIEDRKKHNVTNNMHKKIHDDISAKIAVWIATVLEDSSFKLLEDDLRAKPNTEYREDRIVTLIGKSRQERTSELEEEEGPILDFIDNLVDNVMSICEPEEKNAGVGDVSETTSKSGSDENFYKSNESRDSNCEFDTATVYTYDTGDGTMISKTPIKAIQEIDSQSFEHDAIADVNGQSQAANDDDNDIDTTVDTAVAGSDVKSELKDETDLVRDVIIESPGNTELASQINRVQSIEDLPQDKKVSPESDITPEEGTKKSDELVDTEGGNPDDTGNTELASPINQDQSVEDLPQVEQVALNITVEEGSKESNESVDPEGGNPDDTLDLSTGESFDEKDKKVKFSDIDIMVPPAGGLNLNITNETTEGVEKLEGLTDSKYNLVIGPPNEHLLSDVDELWPDDITPPIVKPSASVSRSITSLGRIYERDEVLSITDLATAKSRDEENDDSYENVNARIEPEAGDHDDVLNSMKDKHKALQTDEHHQVDGEGIKSPTNQVSGKGRSEKDVIDKRAQGKGKEILSELEGNLPLDPQRTDIKDTEIQGGEYDKTQRYTGTTGQQDFKTVESETNFIYEAVQQKIKSSYAIPESKFDYKVHPSNTPSWLRQDSGKGEPSEDSFRDGCKAKAKFKENEIRSWCKDLEHMCVNMEMWSGWLETTCKNVYHLKQKREMNKLCAPCANRKDAKDWVSLKKNIDKDAILWTKLNHRAFERLKCYKEKAQNHLQIKSEELCVKSNGPDDGAIEKTLEEIDRICLWMHRTIVSTEYCMACDCKNNSRRKTLNC